MPDESPLDIAHLDNWFGFRPGMSRAQVLARLEQLGIEETENSEHGLTAAVHEQGMEFWFEPGGSERLRQISLDDDVAWNGRPLMVERLDDALRAFEPLAQTPMWVANDACDEAFPEPGAVPAGPRTDEELLEEGTVWLPDRGIGLSIWAGDVMAVVWRETRDLPAPYAGPVTEAQRQLSRRPDLADYLRSKSQPGIAKLNNPLAPLSTFLAWVCIALLVIIGKEGFKEMKRWNTAPVLNGKCVAIEQVPRKKYLDLAPERVRQLMPDDPMRHRDVYRVSYLDPTEREQFATIEAAEFYVPPREIGDEVQIAYLAGDPPRVKGLSRARDSAFLEYLPWAMAVGALFIVGQFVIGFVPHLLRFASKAIVPKSGGFDPDRPELR